MAWLAANWFWALIFVAFVGMHLVGHGGHGGHGSGDHQARNAGDKEEAPERGANTRPGGHQH
jgi:hypothetical protein